MLKTWPSGLSHDKNLGLRPQFLSTWVPRAMFLTQHGKPWLKPIACTYLSMPVTVSKRPLQLYINSNIKQEHAPNLAIAIVQQGKSEGFESCDRPIVRKRPIRVKSGDVLSRVTLKFDGWLWKTIGHLSFAVSSFVQHFITISEFKLELLSRNAQFR